MYKILQITDQKTPALLSTGDVSVDVISIYQEPLQSERQIGGEAGKVSFRAWRRARFREFTERCADGYDLIVLPSFGAAYQGSRMRRRAKTFYERNLLSRILRPIRNSGAALAILDYSDDYTIHPSNRILLDNCDVYFKRELAVDRWSSLECLESKAGRPCALAFRGGDEHQKLMEKLHPLSLGLGVREEEAVCIKKEMGTVEKKYDLFYAGVSNSRPLRENIIGELEGLSGELQVHVPQKPLSYRDYVQAIADSWMCLSPPGLGWDCYRHYEALFFGSIPVVTRPDILMHTPLRDGFNACVYDSEVPLAPQLREWAKDRVRLQKIMDHIQQNAGANSFMGPEKTEYIVSRVFLSEVTL